METGKVIVVQIVFVQIGIIQEELNQVIEIKKIIKLKQKYINI